MIINAEPFVWFTDEDIAIVGDDICSKCKLTIAEDEVPLMLFREHSCCDCKRAGRVDVARFHWSCAEELIALDVLKLQTP